MPGSDANGLPDWRDPDAYRLDQLDRPGFAWEWLRRDPAYRVAACGRAGAGPMATPRYWGLIAFEPPDRAAPDARPLWSAEIDAAVIPAEATAVGHDQIDAFRLDALAVSATVVGRPGIEHLLLSNGWNHVRVDIVQGTLGAGPVALSWRLTGIRGARRQVLTLRRFLSVVTTGRFSRKLWPNDARAARWSRALRVHDALAAGARQRDVAELLAGSSVRHPRWRIDDPSLRLRAQRIVALARSLQGRGFADRYLS